MVLVIWSLAVAFPTQKNKQCLSVSKANTDTTAVSDFSAPLTPGVSAAVLKLQSCPEF